MDVWSEEKVDVIAQYKNMIPKIIHYCWFGRGNMPIVIKWCIEGWKKKMPDYQLKLWNEDNFDVDSTEWTRTSYAAKKYAFVADYVRLYALYTEGGIFLDADMKVLKSFDKYLEYDFVSSFEFYPGMAHQFHDKLNPDTLLPYSKDMLIPGMGIAAGAIFSCKGHPYINACLDWYKDRAYIKGLEKEIFVNGIITKTAEQFGFKYTPKFQYISEYGMAIFEPDIFALNSLHLCNKTCAIHLGLGSWTAHPNRKLYNMKNPSMDFFINYILRSYIRKLKHLFMSKDALEKIYRYSYYK